MLVKISIAAVIISISALLNAQVRSVEIFSDYSISGAKKLNVNKADAIGGGVKIKFYIFDDISLNISGGYKLYSVNQEDQLNTYGWRFWTDRYYNKIVSDLRADPNLSVDIGSIQKMDLIPVIFSFDYNIRITEDFGLYPEIGGGVYFYTRRMYAVENWSKYFPHEDYTFKYSFRNFAPAKKGNPFFYSTAVNLYYNVWKFVDISVGAYYSGVLKTKNKFGFNNFIFENETTVKLGIILKY